MTNAVEVEHQAAQSRFVLNFAAHQAVLEYTLTDGTTVDFYRTYVPPEFRGKGFAEKLVRHGLAWAKDHGYEVHASCWYVQKFLRN